MISINKDDFDDKPVTWRETLPKLFNLREFFTKIFLKNENPFGEINNTKEIRIEFTDILRLMKEIAENNNSNFYFVYLPTWDRYRYQYDDKNYEIVLNKLRELNISYIDIHKSFFSTINDPLNFFPFGRDGHFTPDGYKKISEVVFDSIK